MTNGLLSMFGQEQSPFANWFDPRRNAITQFGAGLVGAGSTRDALRGASQGLAQGAQMDSVYALQKQEEQKAQDQLNSTIQYLQQAHPDLAAAVSNGADMQSVWGEAMRRDGRVAEGPGSNLTANQRDFMFSQEHPEFADFLGRGSGSSQIGTIPQGYQLVTGEDGSTQLVAIPGGPAALEQQEDAQRRSTSYERADNTSAMAISAIDNALEATNFLTTGPVGSAGRWVGATPNLELEGYLNTVKAQLGFEQLQAMREASPTGGALGQVTERELTFLQSVVESLDARYGEENIDQRLGVVRNLIQRNRVYRQLEAAGITDLNDPVAQEALARFPLPAGTALPALPSGPGSQPNGNTTSTNVQYRILD